MSPTTVAPRFAAIAMFLLGGFAGTALPAWSDALDRAFGTTATVDVIFAVLTGLAAFAGTTSRLTRPGPRSALIILAVATALVGTLPLAAGGAMKALGAGIDAGAVVTNLVRLVLGGVVIGPLAFLAGLALRNLGFATTSGQRPPSLAGAALGASLGVLATYGGPQLPIPPTAVAPLGAIGGAIAAFLCPPAEADPSPPPLRLATLVPPLAVALAATVTFSLARRVYVGIFGNDLPEPEVTHQLLAAGAVGGALLAGGWQRLRGATLPLPRILALLSLAALLTWLGRFGELPSRFAAIVADHPGWDTVRRTAYALAAPRTLPLGVLLGFAAGFGTLRREAVTGGIAGIALGVLGGLAAIRWAFSSGDLTTVVGWCAGGVAITAVLASFIRPGARLARFVVPTLGLIGVLGIVIRTPAPDREGLLVERDLKSPTSRLKKLPKHWLSFDVDTPRSSIALLQRGHVRRLLVNGRFELINQNEIKTPGVLAYAPIAVHPDPRRILLLGCGNGGALESALAVQSTQVDCIDDEPARIEATRRFGPVTTAAVGHKRHHPRIGDFEDLLRRAEPYDIILSQPSGVWTARSAQVSTREFLELVRERLNPNGLYAQWIPDSSLTKEGFQILIATLGSVFPQVEAWAGQDGDVVLLAKSQRGPHDFAHVATAYRHPIMAIGLDRAWIPAPEILLSQFLVDDRLIRRIADRKPIHSRAEPHLGWREAARRAREDTVNPVPGLAEIRSDPLAAFTNLPGREFAQAVANAIQTRALESRGIDLETVRQDHDAIDCYEEGIELTPDDRATRRALASLRSRIGIEYSAQMKTAAAYNNMREALRVDSTYASGFANLGSLLYSTESFDFGISVMNEAIKLAPEDDLYYLLLGRLWKRRGYLDKALPFYEKAMELNELNVDSAMGWVDTKLAMQGAEADLQMGIDFLTKYVALEPHNEILLNRIGRLRDALRSGRSPQVVEEPLPGLLDEAESFDLPEDHEGLETPNAEETH